MAERVSAARQFPPEPGPVPAARTLPLPPFSVIYRDYFAFVWSSARRQGVPVEAIDDVVQEVFIVIHNRLPTLERPEALRSWIYGIVRRTVSTYHRSRRTRADRSPVPFPESTSQQSTPLDQAEHRDQVRLLWSLLDRIDSAKREVFVLAELEELTVPEIAELLELPVNTVYSRLRAARQAFNEVFARYKAQHGGQP